MKLTGQGCGIGLSSAYFGQVKATVQSRRHLTQHMSYSSSSVHELLPADTTSPKAETHWNNPARHNRGEI